MKRLIAFVSAVPLLGVLAAPQSFSAPREGTLIAQAQGAYLDDRNDTFQETSNELAAIKRDFDGRSKPYTLDEAISFAIANNPTIQAAYRSVQSKQWSAISDKRLWWPTASGAGPYGDVNIVPTWPTLGQRYNSTEKRSFTTATCSNNKPCLKTTESKSYTVLDQFVPAVAARWTFFDMPRGQAINSSTEAAKAEELLFNMTVRDTILKVQEGYYALFSEISYLESLESDYRENVDQL